MKKIKWFFVFMIVAVCTTLLFACGDNKYDDKGFITIDEIVETASKLSKTESGTTTYEVTGTTNFDVPAEGFDTTTPVTITFYHTMGKELKEILDAYITEFNALYPNITIDSQSIGSYDDVKKKISTELNVGGAPNIAYCYPDHVASYNVTKKVITLDKLIDSTLTVNRANGTNETLGFTQEQKDDFIEAYYNEGRQFGDGLMYCLPFSKSTEVLYYNKTFFTQNNLSVPDHWFSTSENDTTSMYYVMNKIKELAPQSIPLGYDSEANWFITMAEQCGAGYTSATGNHYLFNNSTIKTLLLEFRGWYTQGLVTTQELHGSYTSGLFTSTDAKKCYMCIGSSAGASHQLPAKDTETNERAFEVGIAPIPQMNQNNAKVISQGPSVCIFDKANKNEVLASWLFVKYLLTSVPFQAEFSLKSGYVPVIKSVMQNPLYAGKLAQADGGDNLTSLSTKVCMEQEANYFTSPAFIGSSKARELVGDVLCAVFQEKDSSLSKVKKAINRALGEAIEELEY